MNAQAGRPTVFDMIGGEEPLRELVNRFYDIVESDPAGEPVHKLHLAGFGISHLRLAQFEFLSGFLGGPQYYRERMGHSNIRTIHQHLAIGRAEIDAWLLCMEKAIEAVGFTAEIRAKLMLHFTRSAETLRNRD